MCFCNIVVTYHLPAKYPEKIVWCCGAVYYKRQKPLAHRLEDNQAVVGAAIRTNNSPYKSFFGLLLRIEAYENCAAMSNPVLPILILGSR